MLDQAHTLRKLVESPPPATPRVQFSPPMVVVTGGRAGVGATTVAVNLATVLADQGERVVLVDGAQQGGDLAQIAGVRPTIQRSLSDVIAGTCSAAEALAPGPAGTLVLANRRSSTATLDYSRPMQQRLFAELNSLHGEASLIVIDTGSGMTPWTRRFWLRSRLVLVVTTTDDLALMDSYALIKQSANEAVESEIRVLANQCSSDAVAGDVYRRLSHACERFLSCTVRALPSLPRHVADSKLRESVVPRVWESPDSAFGHAALWLGRAVNDALQASNVTACATACGARRQAEAVQGTARS